MTTDLYSELGIPRTASASEIKKAYRALAKKFHPDVNPGDAKAEERFKRISQANDVLGDPKKRKLYDEFGDDAIKLGFDPEKARMYRQYRSRAGAGGQTINIEDLFGGGQGQSAGGGFNIGDIFGDIFGGGGDPRRGAQQGGPQGQRQTRVRPTKGADINSSVGISLKDACMGTERSFTLSGSAAKSNTIKVKIPAGVSDGQIIRAAAKGSPGQGGGPPGDLRITVNVLTHPALSRITATQDLVLEVPITIAEAILGATIFVPTLDAKVRLKVPAGTQTGSKLRLKGKGIHAHGKKAAGDLFVRFLIQAPKDAKRDEVKAAAAQFEGLYEENVRAELNI